MNLTCQRKKLRYAFGTSQWHLFNPILHGIFWLPTVFRGLYIEIEYFEYSGAQYWNPYWNS